jgi:hypothetical protein
VPAFEEPDDDLIRQTIAAVRTVPDRLRRFEVSGQDIARLYAVPAPLLARLLDHGLPHTGGGDGRRFDRLDVENIGLGMHLRTPRRMAMRWWRHEMAAEQTGGVRLCGLTVSDDTRSATGRDDLVLDRRVVGAACPGSVTREPDGAFRLQVHLDNRAFTFGPDFDPLFDQGAGIRFHLLPEPLQEDIGFAREHRLADCKLATRFLVHQGRAMGVPVRGSEGLFVAGPYAIWHAWIELGVAGEWIPADPFFLRVLAGWGFVDPAVWTPSRSPRFVLWRLDDTYVPLLRSRGRVVPSRAAITSVRVEPAG